MRGIVPMQYAFFRADGRLDLEAFRVQVEACLRAGAPGIAVLGLATEVGKLAPEERSALLEAAAATRGRAPLSVTVFGQTAEEQIAFVREAERAGAASVILQPPRVAGIGERELARFFGRVIDAAQIPRHPERSRIHRHRARRRGDRRARAQPSEFPRAQDGGLGDARAPHDRRDRRRARRAERPRRARAARQPPRRRERHDPRGRGVRRARAGVGRTRRRCGGCGPGGSSLPRGAAAPHLHHAVDGPVPLLRQAPHCAAPGLGEVHDRAPAQAPTPFGLACLERYAAPLIRTSAWHRG